MVALLKQSPFTGCHKPPIQFIIKYGKFQGSAPLVKLVSFYLYNIIVLSELRVWYVVVIPVVSKQLHGVWEELGFSLSFSVLPYNCFSSKCFVDTMNE